MNNKKEINDIPFEQTKCSLRKREMTKYETEEVEQLYCEH